MSQNPCGSRCESGTSKRVGRNQRTERVHTKYPDLWGTMKAVLREKFIELNAYIKKLENSHASELTEHFKTLEQKEANLPKRRRWQKIIKLRTKINKMETKKTIQKNPMRQRLCL